MKRNKHRSHEDRLFSNVNVLLENDSKDSYVPTPTKRNKSIPKQTDILSNSPLNYSYHITHEESLFIAEYTTNGYDVHAAMKAAGLCKRTHAREYVNQKGKELMRNPHVINAITKALEDRTQRILVTKDQVIAHIAKIAYADFGEAYDENNCIKDVKDIPYNVRYCIDELITEVKVEENPITGKKVRRGYVTKIKFCSKMKALQELLKELSPPPVITNATQTNITNNINLSHLDQSGVNDILRKITPRQEEDSELEFLEEIEKENLNENEVI